MKTLMLGLGVGGLFLLGTACSKADADTEDTTDTEDTIDTTVPEDEDCADGADNDGDDDVDCDDRDCEEEPECVVFTPTFIGAGGAFAYDAANDQVGSAIVAGQAFAPMISIFIANQNYQDSGADEDKCEIFLTYTGTDPLPLETIVADGANYGGFTMPEGQYDMETDCPDSFDETTMLGTIDDIAASGWGIGVGAANADIQTGLEEQLPAEQWDYYFGGALAWGLAGDPAVVDYAYGFALDDDLNVLNSAGEVASETDVGGGDLTLLLADDVVTEAGVPPTGYYQVSLYFAYGVTAE